MWPEELSHCRRGLLCSCQLKEVKKDLKSRLFVRLSSWPPRFERLTGSAMNSSGSGWETVGASNKAGKQRGSTNGNAKARSKGSKQPPQSKGPKLEDVRKSASGNLHPL